MLRINKNTEYSMDSEKKVKLFKTWFFRNLE